LTWRGKSSLIGAHRIGTLGEIGVALVYPGAVRVSFVASASSKLHVVKISQVEEED
jgi:hypothetical protein